MTARGFALTEVVVALVVATTSILAGYGAIGVVHDTRERAGASAQADADAAEVRRMIGEWLRGTYLQPGVAGMRIVPRSDGDVEGALIFSTTAARPVRAGSTRVALLVHDGAETPRQGLVAHVGVGQSVEVVALDSTVGHLTVRMLTRLDRRWTHVWNSTGELPAAVELQLEPFAGRTLHPLMSLPILVVLERQQ